MISPRYHLVTIVAIFLALALGLLAGSSFGQPALVGQLEDSTDAQLRRIEELRGEVAAAQERADSLEAFAGAAAPLLVAGRLEGWRVVVITQEGVPSSLESEVLAALGASGAELLATFAAQPSLAGEDTADGEALAAILGPREAEGGTPWPVRAGAVVADRLSLALAPIDPSVDPLAVLLAGGFLAARDGSLDDATRLEIRALQLLVVVLGGTEPGATALATDGFAAALVTGLADAGIVVAAVEPGDAAGSWVGDLPTDVVVSVVGGETAEGAAALVLGLQSRIRSGEGGAYGGDRTPLPPP